MLFLFSQYTVPMRLTVFSVERRQYPAKLIYKDEPGSECLANLLPIKMNDSKIEKENKNVQMHPGYKLTEQEQKQSP